MILITGGKGYIGRNLNVPNSEKIDDEIDILNINRWCRGKLEGIIHLAAISRVKHCEANPIEALRVNVAGTGAMLELARREKAWVIFASSLEAENSNSIYALTKRFGEELCNYYSHRYGLEIVVIRLGDIIGKDNHSTKAIPTIESQIKKGKPVTIINPKQLFNLTHIEVVTMTLGDIVDSLKERYNSKSKIIING